jgi:signal transduction histidine kinase
LVDEFRVIEGMPTSFRTQSVPDRIPSEAAAALFRIAQEALRNVAKHAGKTHVRVTLLGSDGRIRLSVRDLGEGFDASDGHVRGLGLLSMQERARLVGGELQISSELGQGTTVEAEIPLTSIPEVTDGRNGPSADRR